MAIINLFSAVALVTLLVMSDAPAAHIVAAVFFAFMAVQR